MRTDVGHGSWRYEPAEWGLPVPISENRSGHPPTADAVWNDQNKGL